MKIELEITDMAFGGRGVARHADCVVFVPGTAIGETVQARITSRHKSYATAEATDILRAAPERITPACPLAGVCPGCCYQHLNYTEELRVKTMQLATLLKRVARMENIKLPPAVPAPQPLGYRNKIVLHTAAGPDAKSRLGYFAHDNRAILDVPACPLARPEINQKIAELRDAGRTRAMSEDGTEITIRHTATDGVLQWSGAPDRRAPWLREQTILGEIRVPRGAFFQVNPDVTRMLLESFLKTAGAVKPQALWDVYCGAGVFALAAATTGIPNIAGIDNDSAAIRAARHNARKLTPDADVRFDSRGAAAGLRHLARAGTPDGLTVMLDPPRTGLERETVVALSEIRPAAIAYCSCAPDTMARDLVLFAQTGYQVDTIQIFDMFPRTMHFECLALLRL